MDPLGTCGLSSNIDTQKGLGLGLAVFSNAQIHVLNFLTKSNDISVTKIKNKAASQFEKPSANE